MATVQKRPRKLPKLPDRKENEEPKGKPGGARGDTKTNGKPDPSKTRGPPPGRRRDLPPIRRGGRKGDDETQSLEERGSPVEFNQRSSLTASEKAKRCYFFIDGNYGFSPIMEVIHPKSHRTLATLTRDLSRRMKPLTYGVRSIYTPRGQHKIRTLEEFNSEGNYICTSSRQKATGLDIDRVIKKRLWHTNRPDSGKRVLNRLLGDYEPSSGKRLRVGFRPGYDLSNAYNRNQPFKVMFLKNGEPDKKHLVLLNRRTSQTYEQVLKTLSDLFAFAVRKVYTKDGILVDGLQTMLTGPDILVVAGIEQFIPLDGLQSRTRTRNSTNMGSRLNIRSRMQNRRDRLSRTKGNWRVVLRTNALPSAGTQAQVKINVYGDKGNSGDITLGHGDGRNFKPGQVDEFDIQVGNVGEVYKIRILHDNSGDFPGWLCDEVHMQDIDTGEELSFSCRRWLARDEDDQEITRELAVKRPGDPILPLIKYQVDVLTGDMWGGGTEANVYITLYGDRGDTGVRQLYTETKGVYFKQGQMDTFEVEAVSLGHLKRIIIGHDGTGQGNGWYLDKVIIREPPFKPNQEKVFHCGKWLDEGEDDGKIVRELRVQDEYMDDILEKRNFEFEKWKYEKGVQVKLYSLMTGKGLRMNKDLSVEGIGDEKDRNAVFSVVPKRPMRPMFASLAMPSHFLAIDSGRITGLGKGGPYCEFRVRVQQDGTTLFESVKNPLQFLTIGADGSPGDVRGLLDKDPSRRFHVYAKGCFRHKGVIMLGTSQLQSINLNSDDKTLSGRGKKAGPKSQFRVHKVSAGGIRMFESVANPGSFIRLKDGKIDCNGGKSDESRFLVLRHKDKGYVTIQSASQRGLFVGMTNDGKVHTTIDTGVRNIWLYPEVVEWGVPKSRSTEIVEEEAMSQLRRSMTPDYGQQKAESPVPTPLYADSDFNDSDGPENKETPDFSEEGDWSIHVSTLVELLNGDVALVAYGEKGNSGPIILGAPPGKQIFQDNNEDEFRCNLLKCGKLFKIRLELIPKPSDRDPSWRVKDVRLQDLNSNEILKFTFNRWLSREEDDNDIMRELPVQRPGENVLPVNVYMVSVYTGKEMGAETDAEVYITIHGERGDWGKRYLYHSNNSTKFRTGQVDIFYIEAVSLGNLQRCVIGHDATGSGDGWFLDKVVIKESEHATEEYIFPCDRWLDTNFEDRRIERTLMVKEPSPSKVRKVENLGKIEEEDSMHAVGVTSAVKDEPVEQPDDLTETTDDKTEKKQEEDVEKKNKYALEIRTDEQSEPPNGGHVHITLYGEKKKSDQIPLFASDPTKKVFEPGNIDHFNLETDDLGDLYKIRVGRDDYDKWERWYLGEVRIKDESSGQDILFSFNRWLARDMEDGDLCRELPAVLPGKPTAALQHYQVQIHTGDHWGASTDANMYITMLGSHGDSGKRLLHKCLNNRVKFRRGQMDSFEFDVVDMEDLQSVVISHDGRGHGAGIFVEKVVIKEKDTPKSNLQYVFPCGRWLDDHEDNCLTERTLRMIDVIDSTVLPPIKESKKSAGNWSVAIKTSDIPRTSSTAQAYLTVYGTSGHSDKLKLLKDGQTTGLFTQGKESDFQISAGDVGRVTKIRVEHDNSGASPDWRIDYIKMRDTDTQEELVFYLDRWLALDQDDGQICREIPVVRKGAPGLPVLRYIVAVTTGGYKDAGTENGNVSINLIGVDGDTGQRELVGSISKNRTLWQSGQTDIFVVEAVSVGRLKRIELKFTNDSQYRWFVQQVVVSEGARASSQFVCYCHQWMLSSESQLSEFPVSEAAPSTSLIETLESIPKGLDKPVTSKGRWTVYVQTGTQNDSGTTEKVCIVLCGLLGESEPIHINAKDDLTPGSFVKLEAKVTDIGMLFKVRVLFKDKPINSSWMLAKMKLKDQDTGEELHFDFNEWIESTEENPEGATELPAVRPDLPPLKEQIYIVSVKTGDLERAETDANVFCNLIGQWGGTGVRSLAVSSNQEKFRKGKFDSFTLTCTDLGDVQKVVIGHDLVGRGRGWHCESVTVKVAEEMETVFPCNRWLDTGCDDRQLSAELLPLTKLPVMDSILSKYVQMDDTVWNFHIATASVDRLPSLKPGQKSGEVSIVIYGKNSVKGPIELTHTDQDSPVHLLLPGKTDHYFNHALEDIGEIEKIRVSSGYEGDTENMWTIEKVVLEEQNSKESLVFDFSHWVGEIGGDIRKEMPLVLPDMPHRDIIKYHVEVHTSEAEMNASTNANVFITIYGSNSDSGRRHLIRSKDTAKRFKAGQVDKFDLEAVDLGDLEKLVVAKGPGKPWMLEKIVVKKGEFSAEESVFMFQGWIGSKDTQLKEVEETINLTAAIPSNVALPLFEAKQLDLSKGSWTIECLTGGRRGPDGDLKPVVVFCGQDAETKPLPLKSSSADPFQIGLTDMFKVNFSEKIGDLRKVRFGFEDQSTTKAWYLRKIKFEDNDTKDTFDAEVNDWVAIDNKLDGWKEVPVPWPAVKQLPVLKYTVTLKVGDVSQDGWENDVYIYMYGDQGNTGQRLLKHSLSNTEKIKANQVDVFELEAVQLGDLIKIVIGHMNSDKGYGWFLERVIVKDSLESKDTVFDCSSWLDAGQGDGKIERTLFPAQSADMDDQNKSNNANDIFVPLISPKPSIHEEGSENGDQQVVEEQKGEPAQEVEQEERNEEEKVLAKEEIQVEPTNVPTPQPEGTSWTVTTTTGGDASEGTGSTVAMILYGDKGHSEVKVIGEDPEFRFNIGNTDTFYVTVPEDIGELFKVRVGFHSDDVEMNSWYAGVGPTWFLENMTLKNESSGKVYDLVAGQWVKVTEYQDFWRELPVKDDTNQLEVFQYKVSVFTGEESKAGTDANVYLQIFGECGDTGFRKLLTSKTHENKFEQGNKDVFELGAVDLGKLSKLKIKHDGSGPGSGWLLDKIVIQETEDTTIRYIFRYERWLDEGDGENGVEQTLMLSEMKVADEEEAMEDLPGTAWTIQTVTGDDSGEGTGSTIQLFICEEDGHSQSVVIGEREDFRFTMGATDSFNVRIMEDIKDVYKVRLGFHNAEDNLDGWLQSSSQAPTWFLEQMRLTDESKGVVYEMKAPAWIKMDAYQDYWRELPAVRTDGRTTAAVYQYHIEMYTGDNSGAGTDANVSLCLYGEKGDTGLRRLMSSKTHSNKFEQGNCDLFEMNAVDLGKLTKVKVSQDGAGFGSGWLLDKIVVKETETSQTKYVFICGKWLDVDDGQAIVTQEFPLSDIVEADSPVEETTAGDPWTVSCVIQDGGQANGCPVQLYLYGNQGYSGPVVIGNTEGFRFDGQDGNIVQVQVQESVGDLFKVRIGFHGDGQEEAWYREGNPQKLVVENLRLKNNVTGEEYDFEGGVTIEMDRHNDFWRELPVRNADTQLSVFQYHIEVHTGDVSKDGADSIVTLQIFGERGDTGVRRLLVPLNTDNRFEAGGKDIFTLPAVDLGQLIKVKVSHTGSDWFLEKVVVMEKDPDSILYVFDCSKCLNAGMEGGKDIVVLPLSDIVDKTLVPVVEEIVRQEEVVPDEEVVPSSETGPQAEEEDQSELYTGDEWKVYITTSDDRESGTDSNVSITVYGDADNTGPIELGSAGTGFFYTGKTDAFDITLDPEILGQIRKIRLEHDNTGKPWKVEKVALVNLKDKSEMIFPIDRWLSLEKSGQDIAVEIPTIGHDWPVRDYVVRTVTGSGFGSGTDAAVYVNLIGTLGDTGKRYLVHNLEDKNDKFESGQVDTFLVQAVDLGRPTEVLIGHNGQGPGSGWYLKSVLVKESMEDSETYVFTCENWLHDEKDDGQTERIIPLDKLDKEGESFGVTKGNFEVPAEDPGQSTLDDEVEVVPSDNTNGGNNESRASPVQEPRQAGDGHKKSPVEELKQEDLDEDKRDVDSFQSFIQHEQKIKEEEEAENVSKPTDEPADDVRDNQGETSDRSEVRDVEGEATDRPRTDDLQEDSGDTSRVRDADVDVSNGPNPDNQDELGDNYDEKDVNGEASNGPKPKSREGSMTYRIKKEDEQTNAT